MAVIRKCESSEFETIHKIINEAAHVYKGIIPSDRWREPYMSTQELQEEMEDGVIFWGAEVDGKLVGVMGIQDRGDVNLIRHAYVRTVVQHQGIGTRLLKHLESLGDKPLLVGTWADASWAIAFYQKNGFCLVTETDKTRLLRKYWKIPERQIETSVVLTDKRGYAAQNA